MAYVQVAVVVTMEVEASLEVFLIKVIIIIGISALMIAAFFAIYQAIFVMKKMKINSAANFEVTSG